MKPRPSAAGPGQIRVVPLGGLGQIGMNCLAIEQASGIVVVDCGAAFPDDDLGVDVLHPDFSWLLERRAALAGIFLTHGHEDHVGALPYLLSELDVPVWGPPHALGVARKRLSEHDIDPERRDLREARVGQSYQVGPFAIEPIRVAHSIVEASALEIRTDVGSVLHTGDFNFDPDPPDGEPTDEARLRALGDAGVALMLSDSTNIDVPERPGSERAVGRALSRLIEAAPGRVVVGMFASNIQRLMLLGEIAQRSRRRLCLLGRSLQMQHSVAVRIGRLAWPSDLLVGVDDARSVPREALLVVSGGSQAERQSSLTRLARGTHPALGLEPGDSVILSSRVIPGNDRPVIAMINEFLRAGVTVHSRVTDPDVHTSGHAGRSEQRRMLELVRPRCFVPVHGTLHHLRRHGELAVEAGVGSVAIVENGTAAACDGRRVWPDEAVAHGVVRVAVGGQTLGPELYQRRAELGRSGVVTLAVALRRSGEMAAPPAVSARGVPCVDGSESSLRAIALELARALESSRASPRAALVEQLQRRARRKVEELSGARAVVELQLIELDD